MSPQYNPAMPAPSLPEREREAYTAHREILFAEVGPMSAVELDLFEHLVAASWNLVRYRRMTDEIFQNEPNPVLNPVTAKALLTLQRLTSAAERSYRNALKEIRTVQTNYTLRVVLPETVRNITSALADTQKVLRNFPKARKSEKPIPPPPLVPFAPPIAPENAELQNEPELQDEPNYPANIGNGHANEPDRLPKAA